MRAEIFMQTNFRCSAGISHNKVLAKLCAGLHKPNKQTVLTQEQVPTLFKKINIGKVRGLVRIFVKFSMQKGYCLIKLMTLV